VPEAQSAYRQALQFEPDNGAALRGLIGLYVSRGERRAAEGLIASLSAAQRAALGEYVDEVRAGLLRAQADELVASGRLEEAAVVLTRALELDPSDVWIRYDLARVYARQGEGPKARRCCRSS